MNKTTSKLLIAAAIAGLATGTFVSADKAFAGKAKKEAHKKGEGKCKGEGGCKGGGECKGKKADEAKKEEAPAAPAAPAEEHK